MGFVGESGYKAAQSRHLTGQLLDFFDVSWTGNQVDGLYLLWVGFDAPVGHNIR